MKALVIPVVGMLLLASCSNSPQNPPDDNENLNNNDNDPGQVDPGFPCDFDAECTDGLACNGQERCVDNFCEPGIPPCADGLICDEETRRCLECRQNADCDDGLYCNGPESCATTTGRCQVGESPCPAGALCNEATLSCAGCTDDTECDDGQSCTLDSCVQGNCRSEPDEACCEQDANCADSDPCTVDACTDGSCRNVELDCDNGVFCDGVESCDQGTCVDGTIPCPSGQVCDEAARTCNGNAPQGVCCLSGGACQVLSQAACTTQSGAYTGDGTACTANSCSSAPSTGACCLSGGNCQVLTPAACTGQSGSYNGNGSNCTAGSCGQPTPTGACCQTDGACTVTTQAACTGGAYQGNNTICAAAQCPAPVACGDPGAGDCCTEHGTPSCDNASCCNTVCNLDAFCCDSSGEWDELCAFAARSICGTLCPPLDNDDCADAIIIIDGTTTFDTTGAITDGPANPTGLCSDGSEAGNLNGIQTHHDVWYNYVASCTGDLTVSTCDHAGFDTDLVVYTGCDCPVTTANLLACNDDNNACDDFTSELMTPVTQGNCYKVRIGGWGSGDFGSGTVTVTCQ